MRVLSSLHRLAVRLYRDESGATTVEYAVLVAFVLLACAAGAAALQGPAGGVLDTSTTTIGAYPDP